MQVLLTMPITDGSTTDRLREVCVAGEAAYDAADLVDATGHWVEALVLCESLIAQGHADVALVRTHLQLNLGVAWHEAFEHDAAQTQFEAACNSHDTLAPDLIFPEAINAGNTQLLGDMSARCLHVGSTLGSAWRQALSRNTNEAADAHSVYYRASCAHDALMQLASLDSKGAHHGAPQYLATVQCVAMLASIAHMPLPHTPGDWARLRLELANLCLVLVGSCLRRAEKDDVASFNPLIAFLLPKLQMAILDIDDATLTSRWFMRTQGPRAQRPASEPLAHGDLMPPELACRWNALEQFDLAIGAGESALDLDTDDVEDRLRPDSGLLLLSRDAIGGLVLVVMARQASGELSTAQMRLPRSSETSDDCRNDVHQIDSALYAGVTAALVRKAPGAEDALDHASMGQADRPGHEDATQRIDRLVRSVAPSVIALAQTLKHISLVPSGDLHAVPWHHFLAARLPVRTRLRVFPTVADWWRLQRERADSAAACTRPRWLIAAYDAADSGDQADRLYWINVEAELSRTMWRGQTMVQVGTRAVASAADSAPPPHRATMVHTVGDDAPSALLACGHGVAPDGNLARAGVWIATEGRRRLGGRDLRLLSAGDLSGLPSVRRLLLSCCVLGRTDDVFGEPLGILAQAFRHGAEFALGSLVRLGDLEATLFSLSYQWALCSAYASSDGRPDWVEVFLDVQQCIRDQCWPDGFPRWLASHLPAALASVIPSTEVAHNDDDAFEARQSWHRLLCALAQDHQLKVSTPRASQPWHSWLEALAAAVALRPSTQLRLTAPWMVALGV